MTISASHCMRPSVEAMTERSRESFTSSAYDSSGFTVCAVGQRLRRKLSGLVHVQVEPRPDDHCLALAIKTTRALDRRGSFVRPVNLDCCYVGRREVFNRIVAGERNVAIDHV